MKKAAEMYEYKENGHIKLNGNPPGDFLIPSRYTHEKLLKSRTK